MTDTSQQSTPQARVTIEDVRAVLEGTDPNTTNASKVRGLLGNRGSFETIQKHLNTLRAELAAAAAPPVAADAVPAVPTEAVNQIWVAAWTAAQASTLARSEKLAGERDAALLRLETMGQDLEGMLGTVDEQAGELDQAAQAVATVQAAHLADVDRLTADLAAAELTRSQQVQSLMQEVERTQAALAKSRSDAQHAAEIADSGRELMRQELARLTDQIGELKAVIYKRVDAAPADVAESETAKNKA